MTMKPPYYFPGKLLIRVVILAAIGFILGEVISSLNITIGISVVLYLIALITMISVSIYIVNQIDKEVKEHEIRIFFIKACTVCGKADTDIVTVPQLLDNLEEKRVGMRYCHNCEEYNDYVSDEDYKFLHGKYPNN